MDLNPSEEQQQLIECLRRALRQGVVHRAGARRRARRLRRRAVAAPPRDRRAGDGGRRGVRGMGSVTLLDLALVAEQHGRHLGSAPAGRGPGGGSAAGRGRRPDAVGAGRGPVGGPADHRRPPPAAGRRPDHGPGRRGGRLRGLPRRELPCGRGPSAPTGRRWETSAPCPWPTSWSAPTTRSLASGGEAAAWFERARDEWLALTANALAGIGRRSLEIGAEYVKERRAFGVPIGSFQAVAHGLADAATASTEGPCWPGRRRGPRPRSRTGPRSWPPWPVPSPPRRPARPATAACTTTAGTGSCSSTTSSSTSAGPRRGRRRSASRPPSTPGPRPAGWPPGTGGADHGLPPG